MGDRELLELAAKAYGDPSVSARAEGPFHTRVIGYCETMQCEVTTQWNPLIDDGDALRLAVKLDLHVQCDFKEEDSKVYVYGGWVGNGIEEELGELDKFAATRRAIVRAAAEIGKAGAQ